MTGKKKPTKKQGAQREPGLLCHRDKKRGDRAFMILNGKRIYLGAYGTRESKSEYERIKGRWLANGRQWPVSSENDSGPAVITIVNRYWVHAQEYYRRDGKPTGEAERNVFYALRPMVDLYEDGKTLASEFGPPDLELVRDRMVAEGLSRTIVNKRVGIIRRMFRWAESKGMAPKGTFHNLATLESLKAGRTEAHETEEVESVEWQHVRATLEHLAGHVAAMVLLQWETAMRPGEVVQMRACDIDRTDSEVWFYRPAQHKNKHRGKSRTVRLFGRSQTILGPYLDNNEDPTRFLFAPKGHKARHDCYSTTTYAQAVRRAIAVANAPKRHKAILETILPMVPAEGRERLSKAVHRIVTNLDAKRLAHAIERQATRWGFDAAPMVAAAGRALDQHEDAVVNWSPNQLRHAAATRIARETDLETAMQALDHTSLRTTRIYVDPDEQAITERLRKLG